MKRKYRNDVDFVVGAFEGCWRQASSLLKSAEMLFENEMYPLALSIAVLAIEEVGKLMIIDGLLFSKSGDQRAAQFEKGVRSHSAKLAALDVFPFFVDYLGTLDPRYATEPRFVQALVITLGNYKRERQALAKWLGKQCDLRDLDVWKQRGFYTHQGVGGKFVMPNETIERAFAEAVIVIARRFVTTVEFLLKGNVQRYRGFATAIRSKWSEADHHAFTAHVSNVIDELFFGPFERSDDGAEDGGSKPH